MENLDIYIELRHWNFWYFYYGLSAPPGWEDIILYKKVDNSFEEIGEFTLCSANHFEYEPELSEDNYKEGRKYVEKVDERYFFYEYDEDFYEVAFEARRNKEGIKPFYIELWHPAPGIDLNVLQESVTEFCSKFLKIYPQQILWKKKNSLAETTTSFLKYPVPQDIVFADELVQELAQEWNKSKQEVLEILNKSVGKESLN